MQTITPAKTQSITINSVLYSGADIAKAVSGSVPITPKPGELVDLGDAIVLQGYEKTAVFKTEGKLRIVARGSDVKEDKKFVLMNKHSLKKTHAEYESAQTAYRPAPEPRYEERPRFVRRERSY